MCFTLLIWHGSACRPTVILLLSCYVMFTYKRTGKVSMQADGRGVGSGGTAARILNLGSFSSYVSDFDRQSTRLINNHNVRWCFSKRVRAWGKPVLRPGIPPSTLGMPIERLYRFSCTCWLWGVVRKFVSAFHCGRNHEIDSWRANRIDTRWRT
jgi:hypothetical protein